MSAVLPPPARALAATLRAQLPDLKERYGVRSLALFGSYARGQETAQSDLDVLVEFDDDHPLSLLDVIHLEHELSDLLGVRVDLVEQQDLKAGMSERVLEEASPIELSA